MIPSGLPSMGRPGAITHDVFEHACRDGGSTCKIKVTRAAGLRRRPHVAYFHGFGQGYDYPGDATAERLAALGFWVSRFGLRGRNGSTDAGGRNDAGGREVLDVWDGVEALLEEYGDEISRDLSYPVGNSGGGGIVQACGAKLPDRFGNFGASLFGIASYARWHTTNNASAIAAGLETMLGGSPTTAPTAYAARDHTAALMRNIALGPPHARLRLFHDHDDPTVAVSHSDAVRARAEELGLFGSSVLYHRSVPADAVRWHHGYPEDQPDLIQAEPFWTPDVYQARAWRFPSSSSALVDGFRITHDSEIWIADAGEDDPHLVDSCKHAVRVDQRGSEFAITPPPGSTVSVRIFRGGVSGVNKNVFARTVITVG